MVDTALGEFRGEVLNPLVFIACKRQAASEVVVGGGVTAL